LHEQVSTGQTELIRAMSNANAKGNAPVSLEPPTNAAPAPGMQAGPSPVGSAGPGMSPLSAAQAPAHAGSAMGQQAAPPAFSQSGSSVAPAHLPVNSGGPATSGSTMNRPLGPPPDPVSKKT